MADRKAQLKQFNVYLPVELIREVKFHAVATEQSLSAIVAAALTDHLARSKPTDKERRRGH